MKRVVACLLLTLPVAGSGILTGCTNLTPAEQRALSAGALGAAGGALIGGATGNAAKGAAIGGAAGATGGYLYERSQEEQRWR